MVLSYDLSSSDLSHSSIYLYSCIEATKILSFEATGHEDNQQTTDDFIDKCCYGQKSQNDIYCCVCQLPIKGLIVQALNKTWHPDHFCCFHCKKPISGQKFNVDDSRPYCEHDYAQLFLKRCQACSCPIRDVVVVALNTTWHVDHFRCSSCSSQLANMGFFERDNSAYCQKCYEEKFCPRCKECSLPVTDTAVMALGEKWHQDCFKCSRCLRPVTDSTFEVCNGKPMCERCLPLQISKGESTNSRLDKSPTRAEKI